ncbi:MAG: DUF2840 domain-containing protein [Henriciella sp.]
MSDEVTLVLLSWRKRRINYRLLFGEPMRIIRLDWQRRLAAFLPGSIFGYERWEGNKYGTQSWMIYVAQAKPPACSVSAISGIKPGAELLTVQSGKPACKAFLKLKSEAHKRGMLGQIQPSDWRVLGARLSSGYDTTEPLERMFDRC